MFKTKIPTSHDLHTCTRVMKLTLPRSLMNTEVKIILIGCREVHAFTILSPSRSMVTVKVLPIVEVVALSNLDRDNNSGKPLTLLFKSHESGLATSSLSLWKQAALWSPSPQCFPPRECKCSVVSFTFWVTTSLWCTVHWHADSHLAF